MRKKKRVKLNAQEAIKAVRSTEGDGELEVVGLITNRTESRRFFDWLCGPEAEAMRRQHRQGRK